MSIIKESSNVEFDVIYDDGTRHRVKEGILIDVNDDAVVFHNGTSRLVVIFTAAEALLEVIGLMGRTKSFAKYLFGAPCDAPGVVAFKNILYYFASLIERNEVV